MTAIATAFDRPVDRQDELRVRRGQVRFLRVPAHRFVMIDGTGPPAPEALGIRMPALFGVAYGVRSVLKRRGVEERVGPVEGLWWVADGRTDLDTILAGDRDAWRWTLVTAMPDAATDDEVDARLRDVRDKLDPAICETLRVEWFDEGDAAQLLHVGPYDAERPSIERLHEAISGAGFEPTGRHHEIYVGDPRHASPGGLRTILRQPIRR